ncbi:MAG TPA: cupin domain-containing protein [Gemmatimonadales bacterium]|nr:cupin domain-containing protein [Gemmatimonadales bacterium]
MRPFTLALAALALGTAPALAQETEKPPAAPVPAAKPDKPAMMDQYQWGKAPAGLPEGAEVAVLKGDPTKPGPYTIRLRVPDGYRVAPHSHPAAENLTVVSGVLLVAHGPNMRSAGPATLEAGGKLALAADAPHSVTAKGVTIVEIESTGPFAIKYLNQADDPRGTGT